MFFNNSVVIYFFTQNGVQVFTTDIFSMKREPMAANVMGTFCIQDVIYLLSMSYCALDYKDMNEKT